MRLPILFLLVVGLAAPLHAKPLPLEKLYDPPALTGVRIAPSGKLLSMVTAINGEQHLAVLDLTNLQPKPIARLGFSRLNNIWWTSDDRLLLLLNNPDNSREFKSVKISTGEAITRLIGQYRTHRLVHLLPDKPDRVLFAVLTTTKGYELREFDLNKNRATRVEKDPGYVMQWMLGRAGEVIAAIEMKSDSYAVLTRAPGRKKWNRQPYGSRKEPVFSFIGVHPDQRRLLAIDLRGDTDKLVTLNPTSLSIETLASAEYIEGIGADNLGDLGEGIYSVETSEDGTVRYFLTQEAAKLQQEIDQALPDLKNHILNRSSDDTKLVIKSVSNNVPPHYHLLDRPSGKLMRVGSSLPDFAPADLGLGRFHFFETSDGLKLQLYLLSPPGRNNPPPPIVVMTSSSLFNTRARSVFSYYAQAFASRGYAVARIDHRGTRGYGKKFEALGHGEIAKGIPRDLSEGVAWLTQQGLVDGSRALIMGGDVGGWIAMYTLAGSSTFAGWINFQTPILQNTSFDSDFSYAYQFGLDGLDQKEKIKLTGIATAPSPVELLSKIKVPSFHNYGANRAGHISANGAKIEELLNQNSLQGVMVKRLGADTIDESRTRGKEVYEKLFTFLAEHFPTEQNPRPSTAGRN